MSGDGPGLTLDEEGADTRYKFDDHYSLDKKLSKGSFGTVYSTRHLASGAVYAVKVIDRRRLSQSDADNVNREVTLLKDCRDVEHIVRLVDFYTAPDRFYVIQIFAEGGDVFERLANRTNYNEKNARDLARRLLEAMAVLHERKMAHRDLKPENLLLRSIMDDSEILVADFGFAAYVPEDGLKTRCGTPAFVAPEVLETDCRYDERVDMWSVGCLLYMLIGGYPPFQAPNHRALFRKVRGADFCFHDQYWKNVSVSAKQLIASCLTVDPDYRCSAQMALDKSHWLTMQDTTLEKTDLSASLGEIRKFKARESLKGAIHTVMWSVRSKFRSGDYVKFSKQIKDWDESDEKIASGSDMNTTVRPTLKFPDVYEKLRKIHTSKGTEIWECKHKHTGELFAVKIVDRRVEGVNGARSVAETVMHEVAVLNSLDHPYLMKIIDFFDEEDTYYLIMELMNGGDVFDRIIKKTRYTEEDARNLALFLLAAVNYLHSNGICHRDLKPQNLLLKCKDDDAEIKIADFGFACRVHTPMSLTKRCGTPTYVAPEILKNIPYDQSADMWSVGVILYVLLSGYPPFADDNQNLLFEKIRIGEFEFAAKEWGNVSNDAKDVIRHLLVVDPGRRWTAKQALESQWLRQESDSLRSIDLTPNLVTIKRRRGRLKSIAKTIMWMNANSSTRKMQEVEAAISRPELNKANEEDPERSKMALI